MKPKVLMAASAIFMGILGGAATLLPQEILTRFGAQPDGVAALLVQIAGALYLGFAIQNWMAQGNLMGGIYGKPVALGNFVHFSMVALVLPRASVGGQLPLELLILAACYVILAVWFGLVVLNNPAKASER